jgi:4-hydroxy-tetrahydrodipicolinate synthase
MENAPAISVFPASESLLPKAIALGAGGCISATCNFNVRQIKRVYELAKAGASTELAIELPRLNQIRSTIQSAGLIPALKGLKARETNDPRWLNTRAPLPPGSARVAEDIASALAVE